MGICGSSASQAPNPERVDLTHFELMKVVGKGGFGKVNAIQRKSDGTILALKRMSKCEVVKKESHIRMVWIERNIMAKFQHSSFLLPLEHAFQSDTELFFVMPFMRGGDLRYHLKTRGVMDEDMARFYCAQILLGLEDMHSRNIVYRDLKPENLLLDDRGNVMLSDYGLAVELSSVQDGVIRGSAGTSGYLAPEACAGEYYATAPDCFSFGVVVYELMHGKRPFKHRTADARAIRHMKFLPNLSNHAKSLIRGLLSIDPNTRLGTSATGGWAAVKQHPFFEGIDWEAVKAKSIKPPITPDLEVANCSNQADLADQLIDAKPTPIKQELQIYFDGFDFNVKIGGEKLTDIEANYKPKSVDGKEMELHNGRGEQTEEDHAPEPSLSASVSRSQSASPHSPLSPNSAIRATQGREDDSPTPSGGNRLGVPGGGVRSSHSQQGY